MKKPIRVGFDFDGVIAYNPFRLVRAPLAYLKRNILGVKKLNFWYPKSPWQQIFWMILHESSVFPAKGTKLLQKLIEEEKLEAHLITGRYSFLDNHLIRWLERHKLKEIFKTINTNKNNHQPHLFKETLIKKLDLDIYIEDNLDIVKHLHNKSKTKIFWIYNIVDRSYPHPHKFPHLEQAIINLIRKS